MSRIDTSIYNNLQPTVKLQTPFELEAGYQQIQQGQNQNRLSQMKFAEADRENSERNSLVDATKQYGNTPEYGNELLKRGLVKPYREHEEFQAKQQKAARDTEKANIESHLQKFEVIGQVMGGVRDEQTWQAAKQQITQVLGPEAAANMPQNYDPAVIEQNRNKAMTVKQQLEQKWKELEYTTPTANARLSAETSQANNASSREVTMRGQDMTDARSRDTVTQGNKPPAGYRYTPDGNLETIPGGPADQKAMAQGAASTDLDITLTGLRDSYDRLDKNYGITSTNNGAISNIGASISSSGAGQAVGKMFGTKNQSARNEIAMTRPALLSAIMRATGMSSKQLDSNAELKLWLTTATDPALDVESNRKALNNIEMKYLKNPRAAPNSPGANGKTATNADIQATARATGKTVAQVTADLRSKGYQIK